MIERGADLRSVIEDVGHSGVGITAKLYTRLEEQATRTGVARLNRADEEDVEETG